LSATHYVSLARKKIRKEFTINDNDCKSFLKKSLNNETHTSEQRVDLWQMAIHKKPRDPILQNNICGRLRQSCTRNSGIQNSFRDNYYLDLYMHIQNKNRYIEFPLATENKIQRKYDHTYPCAKWDSNYWPQCCDNGRHSCTQWFTSRSFWL